MDTNMDINAQNTVPPQGDNTVTAQPADNTVVAAPVPTDNADITPEKKEELSRKLHSSKEEALRLKAENERLAAEKEALEAALVQRQQSNDPQVSEQEVEYLKVLGKKAGLAFVLDVEAIKQSTYKEKQQIEFDNFLAKHPELNKPGDAKSDELWGAFQGEIATYRQPNNAANWGKLFDKAYRTITWSEQSAIERGKALGYAQANITNQLGSGSLGGSSAPVAPKSPERQAISEGFAAVRPQYYKK